MVNCNQENLWQILPLENIDLKDDQEMKAKLEGHLKSGDFFEVEKFPPLLMKLPK